MEDVIIIGAGAAGLAAARRLHQNGRRALVLEAQDRLGGRIQTDREFAGLPIERGAEFVHGKHSRSRDLVNAAGLHAVPARSAWRSRVLDAGKVRRLPIWGAGSVLELMAIAREVKGERRDDEALSRLLDRRRVSPKARRLINAFTNSSCASPEQLGVREIGVVLRDSDEFGEDVRLTDGYDRLIEYLAHELHVVRQAPVARVTTRATGVEVEADRRYQARLAIVTVPLGVLRGNAVCFEPALGAPVAAAIDRLAMRGAMKVLLRYAAPLWPRGMASLLVDEAVPVVWPPREDAPVLTAFVMGDRADAMRPSPGPVERVIVALERAWGSEARRNLTDAAVVDWGANPWVRGGYSSAPPGAHGARRALAAWNGPIRFAGEATDLRAPGTVGGAIRAGETAADEALALLL